MRLLCRFAPRNDALLYLGAKNTFSTLNPKDPNFMEINKMSLKYINRKNQEYYLHQGITKTGKPKYYFSMKKKGTLTDVIPDGYEIYENPNGRVFLRKIKVKIIMDNELVIVEKELKKYLEYYKIDVKKNLIIIFTPIQNINSILEIFNIPYNAVKTPSVENLLNEITDYAPTMQFVLIDKEKRIFITRRYCYLGSIDDWIDIGEPNTLENLVKEYIKHIEKDSYYELF